jgi:regulator of protease activity HflC (stomatin/prohibitin superfamily)
MKEVTAGILLIGLLIFGGMWAFPKYNVYAQTMAGQAKLAEAQSSRQVAIAEAKAKDESASFLADAEVKRAEGIAKANAIIGNSLKNNDEYLRYLWIDKLGDNEHQIIYIPTEAGLPLTEAGHRGN